MCTTIERPCKCTTMRACSARPETTCRRQCPGNKRVACPEKVFAIVQITAKDSVDNRGFEKLKEYGCEIVSHNGTYLGHQYFRRALVNGSRGGIKKAINETNSLHGIRVISAEFLDPADTWTLISCSRDINGLDCQTVATLQNLKADIKWEEQRSTSHSSNQQIVIFTVSPSHDSDKLVTSLARCHDFGHSRLNLCAGVHVTGFAGAPGDLFPPSVKVTLDQFIDASIRLLWLLKMPEVMTAKEFALQKDLIMSWQDSALNLPLRPEDRVRLQGLVACYREVGTGMRLTAAWEIHQFALKVCTELRRAFGVSPSANPLRASSSGYLLSRAPARQPPRVVDDLRDRFTAPANR